MNREIKFRAWDGFQMLEPQDLSQSREFWRWLGKQDAVLMQYTGLKDKNGKEIYEGDVIKYDESEQINHWVAGQTALVVWMTPRFTFRMSPYDKFDGANQNMPAEDDSEFFEAIGNIYENPELLT